MMLQEHFNHITISALCQEAGVPRKSFYRYFETKEDVFHLLVDSLLTDCIACCGLGIHSALELSPEKMALCYRFWLEQRQVFDAAQKSGMVPNLLSRMFQFYENSYLNDPDLWQDPDAADRLLFSVSGISAILFQWYGRGFDRTPEEMARLTLELLKNPLA